MLNLIQKLKINNNVCNNLLKNCTIPNKFNYKFYLNKYFSTSNKNYQKLLEELDFEHEDEKDLRYEDQLFFLEREVDKLRKDQKEYGQDYATKDFPEYQQREVTTLIDIVKNFDLIEREYFYIRLKDYLDKGCHSKLSKQNSFLHSKNIKITNDISKLNPNNEIIDKILLPLIPYLASDIFIGGGGGAAGAAGSGAADGKKEAAKEEKKEEKPKEKEEYNIQLAGFDAAKKIALIKEVRAILNLGLKEAKELVEKAPTEIMKKVKKDEAQAIKKKLEEIGAKVELL